MKHKKYLVIPNIGISVNYANRGCEVAIFKMKQWQINDRYEPYINQYDSMRTYETIFGEYQLINRFSQN